MSILLPLRWAPVLSPGSKNFQDKVSLKPHVESEGSARESGWRVANRRGPRNPFGSGLSAADSAPRRALVRRARRRHDSRIRIRFDDALYWPIARRPMSQGGQLHSPEDAT